MDEEYRTTGENGRENVEEMRRFWRHTFGSLEGYLCIVSADRDGDKLENVKHRYFPYPSTSGNAAKHSLAESGRGRETYYTAHLVKDRSSRKKGNAKDIVWLWADLDGAPIPEDPEPSSVLESSRGRFHVGWRLREAVAPDKAEQLNRLLTYKVGGDKGKWALATLLRPPHTTNHKRKGEDWEVKIVRLDASVEYESDGLVQLLGPQEESPNGHPRTETSEPLGEAGEPPVRLKGRRLRIWLGQEPKLTADGEIDRSASLYKIGAVLARAGASPRVIADALAERDTSLGYDKYSDRPDDASYAAIATKVSNKPGAELLEDSGSVSEAAASDSNAPRLRSIVVNDRPLRDVGDEALEALHVRNTPPKLFARAGKVIRLAHDEHEAPIIQEATESVMRHHLARAANFVHERERKDGTDRTHVHPPRDVVQDVMSVPHLPFPPLIGVPRTPFFRSDGSLVADAGYDARTRLYYVPVHKGFSVTVPSQPSADDLASAIELLDEAVGDFPYSDEASAANTIALMLSPVLRNVISGPVPLALLDKPAAGTGGSLLAEVISIIATGAPAGMMGSPKNDDEVRKQITSALMRGNLVITIDNVSGRLEAPSLSRALTSEAWEDRILGKSEIVRLPQHSCWIASGNNLQVGGDLPRRCYWVRLDAGVERPWERKGFRHPDLKSWVVANRARLVGALLTLGRHWFAEGKPQGSASIGSFESWSRDIGGVLGVAGVQGFLGNLEAMYERAADGTGDWTGFFEVWREVYGGDAKTTKQIAADVHSTEQSSLRDALPEEFGTPGPDRPDLSLSRKLGNKFNKREGKPHGERRLVLKAVGERRHAKLWTVTEAPAPSGERVSLVSLVSLSPTNLSARARARGGASRSETHQTHQTHAETSASSSERRTRRSEEPKDARDATVATDSAYCYEKVETPGDDVESRNTHNNREKPLQPLRVEEVVSELRRPNSGASINHPLYIAGETTLEILTKSVLVAMGVDTQEWQEYAPMVDQAASDPANHALDCDCAECL